MSSPAPAPESVVDVDAATVFAQPYLAVVLLTAIAGAVDAVAYEWFGIFTSNQAGNLVVVWTVLPEDASSALLSAASVIGCGLGVMAVALLRHRRPWFATPRGSRALLAAASVLIVAAAVVSVRVTAPVGDQPVVPSIGTPQWWAASVAISLAAASLAAMAVVVVSAHGTRASILAPTNAYVEAVRLGSAAGLRPGPTLTRAARVAGFPLAWTCGAALSALLPVSYVGVAMAAGVVLLAMAVALPPDRRRPMDSAA